MCVLLQKKLNMQVIIKPHPAHAGLNVRWLKKEVIEDLSDVHIIASLKPVDLLKIADFVIVFQTSVSVQSLHHTLPVIVYSQDKRNIWFTEPLSISIEAYKNSPNIPFFRAIGKDSLFHTIHTIESDSSYKQALIKKNLVPYIHNNSDNNQIYRIFNTINTLLASKD